MEIKINIPDEIYKEHRNEIESIITETDETIGKISEKIYIQYSNDDHYTLQQAEEYISDHNEILEIMTDKELLKLLKDLINEQVYYINGYHHISGAWSEVVELNVVETSNRYVIFAYVKYGINDGDGSVEYSQEWTDEIPKVDVKR